MKILVCADGSKESIKAFEEAFSLVGSCGDLEVSVIHIYSGTVSYAREDEARTKEDIIRIIEGHREKGERILQEAEKFFQDKDIAVKTILKEGHPAQVITQTAQDENCEMIVIGSRGLGGLKRLFLGSVSNAVLQESKTSVLVVK